MSPLTGGCACGAIRYRITAEPGFSFHCQCRQCQRSSGTGHASLLVVPQASITVEGEPRYFDQAADDGATVSRGFCARCGSPVLGRTTGHPGSVLVAAASLDDPARFRPQRVVFHASAQPWDHVDPDLPVS